MTLTGAATVPEFYYVDVLSFTDTDDDSHLSCILDSCPSANEHQVPPPPTNIARMYY